MTAHSTRFPERPEPLRDLRGDKGARGLIAENPDVLELLSTEDAGVLRDIDYPHDIYR